LYRHQLNNLTELQKIKKILIRPPLNDITQMYVTSYNISTEVECNVHFKINKRLQVFRSVFVIVVIEKLVVDNSIYNTIHNISPSFKCTAPLYESSAYTLIDHIGHIVRRFVYTYLKMLHEIGIILYHE